MQLFLTSFFTNLAQKFLGGKIVYSSNHCKKRIKKKIEEIVVLCFGPFNICVLYFTLTKVKKVDVMLEINFKVCSVLKEQQYHQNMPGNIILLLFLSVS